MKPLILVVCTANSARSQMAEGLLRARLGEGFEVASAGTVATFVRPQAIAALGEIGIDITGHTSKNLDWFLERRIHTLITVCDNARENCPYIPGAERVLHWPFPDPVDSPETERLDAFRRVRDMIGAKIADWDPAG
jgi:arsenate reductase (thioredoxin)